MIHFQDENIKPAKVYKLGLYFSSKSPKKIKINDVITIICDFRDIKKQILIFKLNNNQLLELNKNETTELTNECNTWYPFICFYVLFRI